MNIDKRQLTKLGLRLVTGLFYQDLECRKCGARWRLQEPVAEQQWQCPNGCNKDMLWPSKQDLKQSTDERG